MSTLDRTTVTLIREAGDEFAQLPEFRLRGVQQDGCVVEVDPGLGSIVIGSGRECELVLTDPRVSRRHCSVTAQHDGIVVRDLGSKNGTWLGNAQILEGFLTPAVSLRVGDTRLMLVPGQEARRLPLWPSPQFGEALGMSTVMRALFATLARAAATDDSVLLIGESGTGKDLLARAIHEQSARRDGPFVVVDCGALQPSLVEADLYGYERGAFSGATTARAGLLEQASGGTLYLDAMSELPLDLQPRLLRVLESRQVRRIGSSRWTTLDIRVVAASHRDLAHEVRAGTFRSDLYHRLAVFVAKVPPLREHKDDIPLLADRILATLQPPRSMAALPTHALQLLRAHDWPGNVRELRNALLRLTLLPEDGHRALSGLFDDAGGGPEPTLQAAREAVVEAFERRFLAERLAKHDGNVSLAARSLGVSRQMVHRLLARHGLRGGHD